MRKFKCIKSYNSGIFLTKGNIYYEKDGALEYDDGWVDNTFEYNDSACVGCGILLMDCLKEVKEEEEKVNKFKVGDKVRILDGSKIKDYTGGFVYEMKQNIGKLATIASIERRGERYCYFLVEYDCIYDERGLELANKLNKSLTITTSDSITTLKDGTHTTTINRYYTDKHDERVAIDYVVKKYYDELDEIDRVSKEKHLFDDETNDDYGVIGTPTILTDSIGRKLFIGDVVKVYNKDGSDNGFMGLVCHDDEDGDFIMGCACATSDNSKKEYNYLKEMSYGDISNDNKIWNSCLVIK